MSAIGLSADTSGCFRRESAGSHAVRRVPIALISEAVGTVLARLRSESFDAVDPILVTDETGRYRGVVELRRLLAAHDDLPLVTLLRRDWPAASAQEDQEHAVEAAISGGVCSPAHPESRRARWDHAAKRSARRTGTGAP
jgi:Mg/Co/Ni transporter MgtE